jgi:hypothetical protein
LIEKDFSRPEQGDTYFGEGRFLAISASLDPAKS